jgi:hypothetical protein
VQFSAVELEALESDAFNIGVFFQLRTDPVQRLWLGAGVIEPGTNAVDATGETYNGLGEIATVPEFQQLINGAAERVNFDVSGVGVTADILATAAGEQGAIKQKPVLVGIMLMSNDGKWTALGAVRWIWRGFADFMTFNVSGASGETVRKISLSVGSVMTGRRRRGASFYTDQDQQARSEGDRFCERAASYSQLAEKAWPRW